MPTSNLSTLACDSKSVIWGPLAQTTSLCTKDVRCTYAGRNVVPRVRSAERTPCVRKEPCVLSLSAVEISCLHYNQ